MKTANKKNWSLPSDRLTMTAISVAITAVCNAIVAIIDLIRIIID